MALGGQDVGNPSDHVARLEAMQRQRIERRPISVEKGSSLPQQTAKERC